MSKLDAFQPWRSGEPPHSLRCGFQQIFRLPEAMLPFIDLVVTGLELDLVVGLGDREMTPGQIAEMMGMGGAETELFLVQARQRAVVDQISGTGISRYRAGNFYRRLTYLSMQDYAAWCAVPVAVRTELLDWHLQENIRHHDLVYKLDLLRTDPDKVQIHNRDILLLHEALAIVDAAELHVVVPCDCRTTVVACDHDRWDTCLRLDDRGRRTLEQGEGRIISKQECIDIVIRAHHAGLVHTGQRAEHGRSAILNGNCCPCCSYPFRAGIALGMAKQWPKSHYRVERDLDACDDCGQCVDRCPFGAFRRDENVTAAAGARSPSLRPHVELISENCFGCGLCVPVCPQAALKMVRLDSQVESATPRGTVCRDLAAERHQ